MYVYVCVYNMIVDRHLKYILSIYTSNPLSNRMYIHVNCQAGEASDVNVYACMHTCIYNHPPLSLISPPLSLFLSFWKPKHLKWNSFVLPSTPWSWSCMLKSRIQTWIGISLSTFLSIEKALCIHKLNLIFLSFSLFDFLKNSFAPASTSWSWSCGSGSPMGPRWKSGGTVRLSNFQTFETKDEMFD
jgi:hypothetical protein